MVLLFQNHANYWRKKIHASTESKKKIMVHELVEKKNHAHTKSPNPPLKSKMVSPLE